MKVRFYIAAPQLNGFLVTLFGDVEQGCLREIKFMDDQIFNLPITVVVSSVYITFSSDSPNFGM